jgi:hypothetical protein
MSNKKTETIELSVDEICYLQNIIEDNVESGVYWGNKFNFMKMQEKLLEKLEEAYDTLNPDNNLVEK